MNRQLILLAGLHKTGTTSIQKTCASNSSVLGRAGFVYPQVMTTSGSNTNHSWLMVLMFKEEPDKLESLGRGAAKLAEQKAMVRPRFSNALSKSRGNVIVAAESVSLLNDREMAEMKEWFVGRGFTIRMLCHIRHLPEWINSMIAQLVVGGQRLTIAEAVGQYASVGSLVRQRVETIRRVFPDAEFYSHERAVAHAGGPPGFFFDKLGISAAGVQFVRANEGASDVAVRAISLANERFGKMRNAGANPEFIDVARAIRVVGGRKFALTGDEAAALVPIIEEENAWLREAFGAEFHSPGVSFASGPRVWTEEERAHVLNAAHGLPPNVGAWLSAHLVQG